MSTNTKSLFWALLLGLAITLGGCGDKKSDKKSDDNSEKKEKKKDAGVVVPNSGDFRVPSGGEYKPTKIGKKVMHWYGFKDVKRPELLKRVKALIEANGWKKVKEKTGRMIKIEAWKNGTLARLLVTTPTSGGSGVMLFIFKNYPEPKVAPAVKPSTAVKPGSTVTPTPSVKTAPPVPVPGVAGVRVPAGAIMKTKSSGKVSFVEFTYPQTTTKTQVKVIIGLKKLLRADGWTVTNLKMKRTIAWRLTKGSQRSTIMISKNMKSQMVVSVLLASNSGARTPTPSTPSIAPNRNPYPVGARVRVCWKRKWWRAKVLRARPGKWYIRYIGFGSKWNEWVRSNRIRR